MLLGPDKFDFHKFDIYNQYLIREVCKASKELVYHPILMEDSLDCKLYHLPLQLLYFVTIMLKAAFSGQNYNYAQGRL